jgi:hypothetical protein
MQGLWLLVASVLAGERVVRVPEAGVLPEGDEALPVGPNHLAAGPGGRVALWDAARGVVRVDDGARWSFSPGHVDGLAIDAAGRVLVLDGLAISAWTKTGPVTTLSLPPLAPRGMPIEVRGDAVCVIDPFSNCHVVARATAAGVTPDDALLPPRFAVTRRGGVVLVDGVAVYTGSDDVAARIVGDWVVVRDHGVRLAVAPRTGARVALPPSPAWSGGLDVAAGPDGALAWLVDDDGPAVRVRE